MPMQADKAFLLVDYVYSQLVGITVGMPQLLLKHDVMLILLMWDAPMRVNNCHVRPFSRSKLVSLRGSFLRCPSV